MEMNSDKYDRQKRVANWNQAAVEQAKVCIVGAGALGNEVVKLLLQLGVAHITLIDFDEVAGANLNRCIFFNESDAASKMKKTSAIAREAIKLNKNVKITEINQNVEDLDSSFFKQFTAVFGCLDNLGARLHVNANCYNVAPLIDGGTSGFMGKAQIVTAPSSCIECSMSKNDYNLLWKKYSCIGELLNVADPKMPALPTTTSIVAGIQVHEFLKIIMPETAKETLVGKYCHYNGLTNRLKTFEVEKRKNCPVH